MTLQVCNWFVYNHELYPILQKHPTVLDKDRVHSDHCKKILNLVPLFDHSSLCSVTGACTARVQSVLTAINLSDPRNKVWPKLLLDNIVVCVSEGWWWTRDTSLHCTSCWTTRFWTKCLCWRDSTYSSVGDHRVVLDTSQPSVTRGSGAMIAAVYHPLPWAFSTDFVLFEVFLVTEGRNFKPLSLLREANRMKV